ncbi:tRNA (adenosine(37)-N6)-threonylcarbamoyltransferase complex dimerization subunit type 1 TsaB [Clostridium tyrobutyricum]|uniref:tRNA (adenosine(37)-N6)-threonylcarbamoyltransferase complex dimerization subunit type 1 TsaB n=1 Tax=Clostridium tyrobutyricum TaxID=1519 RepID=UPI001C394ECE|nr:tRNA (adenosine(37)-N6)-threonylcarbamoyltransferase complex dimerization subunit type 1 TsaB [Clostridium tyrobutyricum]MBV4419995.1 tRNA (adenosine(37)-N6)-threonylcarbamoyltransferase complex dimerization subunit type 1 TsaB [Clostridium tyrobutyricum]
MKILSLDSSTESATCSVLSEEKLYGEITFNYKKQHSVILMPIIDSLLKNIHMDINSLDGFVISKGPGSFTGLRIGAAVIKGLSQGSGKPFSAVSSLDALAYNLAYTSGIICPILNALRGNVYTALYKFQNFEFKRISEYQIISMDDLINKLNSMKQSVCFVGDAVTIFKQSILDNMEVKVGFAPTNLNIVRSSSLGELGLKLIKDGKCDNLYTFSPFYLRKSQAEREYERKAKIGKHE